MLNIKHRTPIDGQFCALCFDNPFKILDDVAQARERESDLKVTSVNRFEYEKENYVYRSQTDSSEDLFSRSRM